MSKKKETGRPPPEGAAFPIVGIGASAGGLEAFNQLLQHLPLDTGMAFVLVQHLDPEHESALVQILSRATKLPVGEITDNQPVKPDHVYVIPRDKSLTIERGVLRLQPRQKTRAPHRPIDSFFESLATDQRHQAIGVVLSGTASDGTLGLEAIKAEGGITFAQDDSAKHDSMPRSAVAAGCVDIILAPADIAKELGRIAKHPFVAGQSLAPLLGIDDDAAAPSDLRAEEVRALATEHADDETALPSGGSGTPDTGAKRARAEAKRGRAKPTERAHEKTGAAEQYKRILLLLRNHSGVDFSLYKSNTIQRRIARRLVLNKQSTLADYADFLKGNAKELDALYSDVLISVTNFFRNPETFEALQREVLPTLLNQRSDDPVRIWVLGCSTGQEAYSIAMSFVEAAEKAPRLRQLQIFATDLNDKLLDKARHGLYAKSLAEDISPERLRRFFVEEEGGYRVNKALREMVVFARQNLISDPPFSRMDIISCRNLLIYLEPSLQKRALPTFHYALKSGGYLLLGASESIGSFTDLFETVDRKHKIFTKKQVPTPALHLPARKEHVEHGRRGMIPVPSRHPKDQDLFEGAVSGELNAQREADRVAVSQFAPPSVLINNELQVLQFRGFTGAYLEPPAGKASFDILKMAREGLMLPLRTAIQKAKAENKTARAENVRVQRNGETCPLNVQVIPLKNVREPCFLVVFEEMLPGGAGGRNAGAREAPPAAPLTRQQEAGRIVELETELAETRDYLQSVQEHSEATTEELQAANEEVQSSNEELQSINEELETSKEELESSNEELITLNEETQTRNTELNRLNSDLLNLQSSTKLPVLLLGRDLTIRRFSPPAEKQFDLLAGDVGRPISHIRHRLVSVVDGREAPLDLEEIAAEVIASVREQECAVREDRGAKAGGGRWFLLRVRPYLTVDSKVDGAVVVLVDVDDLKRSEQVAARALTSLENTIETMPAALLVLDHEFRVEHANRFFYRLFQVVPADTIGRFVYDLGNHQWDIPRLRRLLEEVLPQQSTVNDYEVEHTFEGLGERTMLINAVRNIDPIQQGDRILLTIVDITGRKRMERKIADQAEALSLEARRKDEFLAMLSHELRNPLAPIRAALHNLKLHQRGTENLIAQQACDVIQRQVGNLTKLVADLLEVSRMASGRIRLEQHVVDLNQLVRHAIETVRPLIEHHEHELVVSFCEDSAWVHADPTRIEEVIVNLLNNAAKYTPDGGRIEVGCAQPAESNQVEVRVRDNGVGIDAQLLPRIFDLFTQADRSLDRAAGGLGIGLSLAQRLVDMHGGIIEAKSPPPGANSGSEFIVRLPRVASPKSQPKPAPAATAGSRPNGQRVLVVDDNIDQATMLTIALQRMGYGVQSAYSGPDGLKLALEWQPDIVLLDIGLPGLDGYEVARRIRAERDMRHARLVALTGYGRDSDIAMAREAGFNSHMVKPIELSELQKVLARPEPRA